MVPASRRGVLAELAVDAHVGVRLGWVLRVVGEVRGYRLALVCQGVRHELVTLLATMRLGLRGKHQDDYK